MSAAAQPSPPDPSDSQYLLVLGEIRIQVTLKPIRNLHLSVVPPQGAVRISAPEHSSREAIRAFAIGKLAWIRREQARFQQQVRIAPPAAVERASHHLWGRRLLLEIREEAARPQVVVQARRLLLTVRPGATDAKRRQVLDEWYRQQVRQEAEKWIAHWQPRLGVTINRLYVRRMSRLWGSCNPDTGNIRLNTELAKKPKACLEYVVLHELAHLRVRSHNQQFHALLDQHLPTWRDRQTLLNQLPLES